MPVLKSETRIKQIDTTNPTTDVSEYQEGDIVYDQNDGLLIRDASAFGPLFHKNAVFASTFESYQTINGATSVVTHDCTDGHVWYHTNPTGDWTANFTNLNLESGFVTTLTLIISQGATARIPISFRIDNSTKVINWQGGSQPVPTDSGIDIVSFSVLRSGESYVVLGQLVDFT